MGHNFLMESVKRGNSSGDCWKADPTGWHKMFDGIFWGYWQKYIQLKKDACTPIFLGQLTDLTEVKKSNHCNIGNWKDSCLRNFKIESG